MKIYREGREIYEIKDYKQVGKFMEVATIETTIKSTLPIDIKVGDYVIFDYNNLKYTLYDVYPAKKQARSSTYGEAYVYDLKFKADTEQLSICPFLDLVPNDNNLTYSSLPSFSTFENVYGIADRLQANLDYLYPNQWRFDVVETTDAELLETLSDAREFAISGESCLDGLRKIYDIWGVGFIHSVEDGVNIITIGKSAGKTSLFRYGKGRGLRTIKKNLQNSDQLCTRAYVFGSTRNIPARWYNNKGYIGEAQYAPNLMIPPSKWVDGIPQGAYIDAIFNGENRIEKYGLKIKTFSYDGSDSNKTEIYPSVEKMTAKTIRDAKAEIGENTYIPSPTLYPDNERMDMVLEGSNIVDDGTSSDPGYILFSDKQVKSVDEQSETIPIAEKTGDSKYTLIKNIQRSINICTFDIEKTSQYRFDEILRFVTLKKNDYESTVAAILYLQTPSGERIELRSMAMTDKLEDFLQLPGLEYDFKELGKYTLVLKLGVSWNQNWVIPQIGEDVYLTYTIPGAEVVLSRGKKILGDFFNIKIKQIGFNINDYTASSGASKNIHFRSGMCSGMSFGIAQCNYIKEIDAWELKCRRVEDSSISQRFPNSIFNIAKDDRFVLLDINMPDLYIYTNMQRLYDTALEDLKHFSTPQYVIEPQIDNIQMARSPQVLKEGMYMAIDDLDISIFNEEALIDSVTITNRGTDLRSFEVTLRNDKVYNRYNKLADRIADLESAAQKTASNSTITPVQDTSESKVEAPAVGFDENALADYLEENKYTTEGDVTNILSPIDKEVSTLRTDFDNLNALLNDDTSGVIDTWNEVVAFLDGYSQSDDLAAILAGMNEDISNRVLTTDFEKANDSIKDLLSYFDATGNANNALKLDGHSAEYFATATAVNTLTTNLNSLTSRVSTNEQGIATNKTNIATLVGQVKGLADDVEILKGYWYIDDNGNLHTTHNIVVEGGGAFGKGSTSGGDVPSASVSIKFEGSNVLYNPINGVITLPAYPSAGGGVADSVAWSNISGKPNFATVATSGKYSDLSGTPTIPTSLKSPYALTFGSKTYDGSSAKTILASDLGALTAHQTIYSLTINNSAGTAQVTYTPNSKAASLTLTKAMVGLGNVDNTADSAKSVKYATTAGSAPASDVYAWAKAATKPSYAFSEITGKPTTLGGYGIIDALSTSGGTISASGFMGQLTINRTQGGAVLVNFQNSGSYVGSLGFNGENNPIYATTTGGTKVLLTETNYSSYALPLTGGTMTGAIMIGGYTSFGVSGDIFYLGNPSYPVYVRSNGIVNINGNAVIHSGNIGSYKAGDSDKLGGTIAERFMRAAVMSNTSAFDANAMTDDVTIYKPGGDVGNNAASWHNFPVSSAPAGGFSLINIKEGNYRRQIYGGYSTNQTLYVRSQTYTNEGVKWIDWKTIAFTDSNVASATKLQTPRTIWGQSFDGSANVSGNLSLYNDAISWLNDSSNYSIQIKDDGQAYYKAYYGHHFYSSATERMRITSGGNVLIGTTTDSGYKLDVAGIVSIGTSSACVLNMSRTSLNYFTTPTNGYFGFVTNGKTTSMANSDLVIQPSFVIPGATNIVYLGSDNYRWKVIYGQQINLSSHASIGGNLTVAGGGAFGSDIRYKDITSYRHLDLETIVNAPLFTFRWTDREDKIEHLGTSAQYWLDTQFKDAVNTANKDFFHLDYGALGVGIGISVAREVKGVKTEVKGVKTEVEVLRERVSQLEKELAQYRRA